MAPNSFDFEIGVSSEDRPDSDMLKTWVEEFFRSLDQTCRLDMSLTALIRMGEEHYNLCITNSSIKPVIRGTFQRI
jgi:hypothetical protein